MSMSSKWSKNGNYYINCQTLDDYYANNDGKEPPGEWFIATNETGVRVAFNLSDQAKFEANDTEAFESICRGFNPDTGEKLVQNADSPKRRALLDLTLSPDKTVSAVWSQAPEEQKLAIQEAQRDSARAALQFASDRGAYSRQVIKERYRDKNGAEKQRRKVIKVKTSFIAALFEHGSSRADDPQLHTHATILNACIRPDGSTGSIESEPLMRWQGAMASIYHASLAYRLSQQGCAIEMTGNTFRVAGVPADVCEAFSQRRKAIKAHVEKWQSENGMTADATRASKGLLQKATIETRDQKGEKTRAELEADWVDRGVELGFSEAEALQVFELGEPLVQLTHDELLKLAREGVAKITDTEATFKEPALITKLTIHMTGRASVEEILRAIESVKAELVVAQELNEETGELESVYSTHEMLQVERDLQRLAQSEAPHHKLDGKAVEAAIKKQDAQSRNAAAADFKKKHHRAPTAEEIKGLEEEQAAAIRHVCLSDKTVNVVEGTAGAGKTFTMSVVAKLYTDSGYTVHGLSGAWTQALNLKKEAKLATGKAIAGWLLDVQKGNITLGKRDAIVMDEAGMVGVKDMQAVVKAVEKAGAKVILLGDTLQQNSVAAGDALRTVSEVAGSQRLDVIRRQKREDDKAAVPHFFAGNAAKGLEAYTSTGRVHICDSEEATNARIIADWQAAHEANPGRSRIILAVTNAEVAVLNRLAHESRRLAGELGSDSVKLDTMDSKDATDLVQFSVGDDVVFRNNQKQLKDKRAPVTDESAEHADSVYNRTRATIEAIDRKSGVMTIRTEDGRLVKFDPSDAKWQHKVDGKTTGLALQHDYACTSLSSQGLTRDDSFVKHGASLNRRSAGVDLSRHRETCDIYANKEELYESKMRVSDETEWHPISQFSDEEAIGRMARIWSRKSDKTSTLDYKAWTDAEGVRLHPDEELTLANLAEARAAIEGAIKSRDAAPEMPFQLNNTYVLRDSQVLSKQSAQDARNYVMDILGATSRVMAEAERQGFIELRTSDLSYSPSFVGRRPGDGAIVNRVRDGVREEGPLRDRYPPILRGDRREVHVVATGEDALAIWADRELAGKTMPTVIVAGDNVAEATLLSHVRDALRHAESKPVLWVPSEMSDQAEQVAGKAVANASGKVVVLAHESPAQQMREELQARYAQEEERREQSHRPQP